MTLSAPCNSLIQFEQFFLSLENVTITSTGEAGENINYRAPTSPYKVTHKHKDRTEKRTQRCSMKIRYEKLDMAPAAISQKDDPLRLDRGM